MKNSHLNANRIAWVLLAAATMATGCRGREQSEATPLEPTPSVAEAEPTALPTEPARADDELGAAQGLTFTVIGIYLDPTIMSACGMATNDVHFQFDSAKISEDAAAKLRAIAACVKEDRVKGQELVVIGRASPPGSDEYNQKLGMSRAESVKRFLADQGVATARVETVSTGEPGGVAGAMLDENRWPYGRRVDIRLVPAGAVDAPK